MFESRFLFAAAISAVLAACGGGGRGLPSAADQAQLERGDRASVVSTQLKVLPGSPDDTAAIARLLQPAGVMADATGNTFVADRTEHTLRNIAPDGTVSTLAGTPGVRGATDGEGAEALFDAPWGLALDDKGGL